MQSQPIIKPSLFITLVFGAGLGLFYILRSKGLLSTRRRQLAYFFLLLVVYFISFLLLRPDTGADLSIPPSAVF